MEPNDQQIRDTLGTFMGWRWIKGTSGREPEPGTRIMQMPDYLKSLDAMSAVEQAIQERGLHGEYARQIRLVACERGILIDDELECFPAICMDARNRAAIACKVIEHTEKMQVTP